MSYHCSDETVGSKIDIFQEEMIIKKPATFSSLVVEVTFLRLTLKAGISKYREYLLGMVCLASQWLLEMAGGL